MHGNSKEIFSNQSAPYEDLEQVVKSHIESPFQKPVILHTQAAFDFVGRKIDVKRPIILDSGCGTGESTFLLAKKYPDCQVVGIDKSFVRLRPLMFRDLPANIFVERADQFDFWRLLADANWPVQKHFIFYPNPWPKKSHFRRRIHGHPAFTALPKITPVVEVRSNWLIYLLEFARAWELLTNHKPVIQDLKEQEPVSLFEKKYRASGHKLYRLCTSNEEF